MAFLRHTLLLALIGHIFIVSGQCEESRGYEFVFSIPSTNDDDRYGQLPDDSPCVLITTPFLDPVDVTLTIPGIGFHIDVKVTRAEHANITLPNSCIEARDSKQNKTILIRASDMVSVFVINGQIEGRDGFLAIPASQLGEKYYVASYAESNVLDQSGRDSYPSFFSVSALGKKTLVDIITKSGLSHPIVLDPYESYRFDGDNDEDLQPNHDWDLTGTIVQADNPIAVVSGSYSPVLPGTCFMSRNLLEQLLPVNLWGRHHILSPFLGSNLGYLYRALSASDTTTLRISNIGTVQLDAKEVYEGDVTEAEMVSITSDKPVLVMQYMKCAFDEKPFEPFEGGPSMMLVPALEIFPSNVTFALASYICPSNYYINVIVNCSFADGLIFDDQPMADWDRLTTDDQLMCSVRGKVNPGVHSVIHHDPSAKFAVSVYTVSLCLTSCSYSAGISYSQLPSSSTQIPHTTRIPVSESTTPRVPSTQIRQTTRMPVSESTTPRVPSSSTQMPVSESTTSRVASTRTQHPQTTIPKVPSTQINTTKIRSTVSESTTKNKTSSATTKIYSNPPEGKPSYNVAILSASVAMGFLLLIILMAICVVVILTKRSKPKTQYLDDYCSPNPSDKKHDDGPITITTDGYAKYNVPNKSVKAENDYQEYPGKSPDKLSEAMPKSQYTYVNKAGNITTDAPNYTDDGTYDEIGKKW